MNYKRRLWCHLHLISADLEQAGLVKCYHAVCTNGGVVSLWHTDGLLFLRGVEHHNDVTPGVASGIVLQSECHYRFRSIEELQMLAYQIGIAQPECWMQFAQMDKTTVVCKDMRIAL